MTQLYSEVFSGDSDLLVLLHGLGATSDVWTPFVAARPSQFSGRIVVMDLPGHGASDNLDDYAMTSVAGCVAEVLSREVGEVRGCLLLGHSYGGVAALELANSKWGLNPRHTFGLSIKTFWTEDELAHISRLAARPPKKFSTEQAANEWYQKTTGLAGLTAHPENYTRRGVHQCSDGQWSLALDPGSYAIADPGMARLIDNAACPFSLGYGASDTMIDARDMRRYDSGAQALSDGSHNIIVTHPESVWAWIHQQLQG